MRILVIEDDEDLADAIVRRLRRLGHAVDWQNDGLSADGVLQYESFDLVILDIGLPRMSGFDILHRLRDRGSKIPVLALTARIDIEDRVHALDTGADDYLAKPFDFRELEARRALLRRPSAGRRRAAFRRSGHRQRRAPAHAGRPAHRAAKREYSLLEILLAGMNRAVSRTRSPTSCSPSTTTRRPTPSRSTSPGCAQARRLVAAHRDPARHRLHPDVQR